MLISSCNPKPMTIELHVDLSGRAQLFNTSSVYKYHTRLYMIHSSQIMRGTGSAYKHKPRVVTVGPSEIRAEDPKL